MPGSRSWDPRESSPQSTEFEYFPTLTCPSQRVGRAKDRKHRKSALEKGKYRTSRPEKKKRREINIHPSAPEQESTTVNTLACAEG